MGVDEGGRGVFTGLLCLCPSIGSTSAVDDHSRARFPRHDRTGTEHSDGSSNASCTPVMFGRGAGPSVRVTVVVSNAPVALRGVLRRGGVPITGAPGNVSCRGAAVAGAVARETARMTRSSPSGAQPLRNREDVAFGKKPPLAFHQPAVTAPVIGAVHTVFPECCLRLADRGFMELESSSVSSSVRVDVLSVGGGGGARGVEDFPNRTGPREVGDPAGGVGTEPGLGPAGVSAPRDHCGILIANFDSTPRRRLSPTSS